MKARPIKGMPYAPDVRRLLEKWPIDKIEPNDVFSYDEVADVINEEVDSSRWRGVTMSWRRLLAKHDIHIDCPGKQTFRVLDNLGKLHTAVKKQDTAARIVRKSAKLHASVDRQRLEEPEQRRYDLVAHRNSAFAAAMQIRGNGGTDQKRLA